VDEKLKNSIKRTKGQWTIKEIPFTELNKPIKTNWGALLGAVGFFAGIYLLISSKESTYLIISAIGFVTALLSLLTSGRKERKNWQKITAKCIDIEIAEVLNSRGAGKPSWGLRTLCEFYYQDKTDQVTPSFWRTFASEQGLLSFLNDKIAADNTILLYVSPENPLQTEIWSDDIKDKLLHSN